MSTEKLLGWNEFAPGAILFPYSDGKSKAVQGENNSSQHSVADWRVQRPVLNLDVCIHCQLCWPFCPDSSLIAKDRKLAGIDYEHCKGCGICSEMCPTTPKAILMFPDQMKDEEAIAKWPPKPAKQKALKE
jgi:pyruvate ferredoxin oxidoreductase delta subunit